jgi:hypothetical protein
VSVMNRTFLNLELAPFHLGYKASTRQLSDISLGKSNVPTSINVAFICFTLFSGLSWKIYFPHDTFNFFLQHSCSYIYSSLYLKKWWICVSLYFILKTGPMSSCRRKGSSHVGFIS